MGLTLPSVGVEGLDEGISLPVRKLDNLLVYEEMQTGNMSCVGQTELG